MQLTFLQIPFLTPEYDEIVGLRTEVLRKPLGLEFSVEFLEREHADLHLAAYNEQHQLVGCLLLTQHDDSQVQMRQVAVAPSLQGKGIGRQLVAYSEKTARQHNFTQIFLHARQQSVDFYLKNGYQIVDEPFTEVGILHRKMIKTLE